jgi:hypothetical protein
VKQGDETRIRITDQGVGFDWRHYVAGDDIRRDGLHGRGIALAVRAGFESVEYIGSGNEVVLTARDNRDR